MGCNMICELLVLTEKMEATSQREKMSKLKIEKVGIRKDKPIRNGVIYRRLEGPYFTGREDAHGWEYRK